MSDPFDFEAKPDLYAVMGNPISHSLSPRIHSHFAQQTGQRMTYEAIQVDPGGFAAAVGNFVANGGKGLNVTVPFKQEAWELVDIKSERAQRAAAVNTMVYGKDRKLYGDNTDGIGLVRDLQNHEVVLHAKKILIIGAGGAVRGVLAPLLAQQPQVIVIVNRTKSRALDLSAEFTDLGAVSACAFEELEQAEKFDLVINGTSASLHGECPPLPENIFNPGACSYDMMYGRETPFMQWSRQQGVDRVMDGLGMLVEQAAESFFIWRSVRPQTAEIIRQLRQ